MAALSPVQAGITFAGACEPAWEPDVSATTYHVYRASTSGGTYAQIATVSAPQNWYTDTGYSAGNCYKVTWDNGGSQSPLSAEMVPTPCHDNAAVPARHDRVSAGSTRHLAQYDFLQFTQAALNPVVSGPTSTSGLFDDTFQGSSPLATLVSGTQNSCGGGSISVSATAGTYANLRYSGHIPAPSFGITVDVTSMTSGAKLLVGYGLDATHGVFVRYNDTAHTIDIFGVNGAGETSLRAATSLTLAQPFKLCLEVIHQVYICWYDTGSGWTAISSGFATNAGTYDLRFGTGMATWEPLVLAGGGAGSVTTVLSRQRACIFSGTGGVRECQVVTDPGGKPIPTGDGSTYYVAADRVGPFPPPGFSTSQAVSMCVMKYNPTTHAFTDGAVCNLTYFCNGQLQAMNDGKVIYEAGVGLHIWSSDWTDGDDTSTEPTPSFVYCFLPGGTPADLTGWLHFSSVTQVTLPAGPATLYSTDILKIGSTWYLLGGSVYPDWYTYLCSGSSPSSFPTIVASDQTRHAEGCCFLEYASRLYAVSSAINDPYPNGTWGKCYVWDISDLATMTYMGLLDYPSPMTGNQMPQQPTIFWLGSTLQLLGHDDTYFTRYQDNGQFQVCEATLTLTGTQFPPDHGTSTVGWVAV